jgi:carboxypeptidase C (cathepsin A)
MPIRDAKGEAEARIFFMAYTRDDAGPAESRPLLFSFNGGPGSSSVWLHLGALGPRRVPAPDEPTIPGPPFKLVDNDATWLDRADLVFIDPVGTGYSRAAKPELNAKFHSLRGDIQSIGEFIRMYLTRYDRWSSPLFVIGESYGTTRAAGLAGHLVDHGIALSGVILVSCAIDFQGFFSGPNNDLPFLNYLPSFAAAAWYHKKLPADLQKLGLPELLKEVENWVDREYVSILARGDRLGDAERHRAAERLARYTGLKADDIEEHRLRITMSRFCRDLLKSDHRSIGRYDARYKGIENPDAEGDGGPSFDPSYAAVHAPYTTTFNHYVRAELGYKSDLTYHILGGEVGPWDFQTRMGYPSTAGGLRDAMSQNPHLRVLVASGYYDLATPYRAVEHTLATLGLDPTLRKNIAVEYYEAGHMMYLHGSSLHKLKRDGVGVIERALKK